jgi:pyruvate-ferredoxin/flavodoxin oxidoreductase
MFYGLGSDGTVGANKNSIKIIGEETDNYAQGYFVYDSKKAGSMTVSHLRFGPSPIRSTYLITRPTSSPATRISSSRSTTCSNRGRRGVVPAQHPLPAGRGLGHAAAEVQQQIIDKKLKFYVIDAYRVAREAGMGAASTRSCRPASSRSPACCRATKPSQKIKDAIKKTYGAKGEESCKNLAAVDQRWPTCTRSGARQGHQQTHRDAHGPAGSARVRQNVVAPDHGRSGDDLPVSACRSTAPSPPRPPVGEALHRLDIPEWDPRGLHPVRQVRSGVPARRDPHAKVYDPSSTPARRRPSITDAHRQGVQGSQVHDPGRAGGLHRLRRVRRGLPGQEQEDSEPQGHQHGASSPLREPERENYEFFLDLPKFDRAKLKIDTVKGSQFLQPLFEYSGACAGCGETPYVKLLSQLFGDRAVIANATGCSSIYGGNLPTTPWAANATAADPRGATRCSRTTRSSAWASA